MSLKMHIKLTFFALHMACFQEYDFRMQLTTAASVAYKMQSDLKLPMGLSPYLVGHFANIQLLDLVLCVLWFLRLYGIPRGFDQKFFPI